MLSLVLRVYLNVMCIDDSQCGGGNVEKAGTVISHGAARYLIQVVQISYL